MSGSYRGAASPLTPPARARHRRGRAGGEERRSPGGAERSRAEQRGAGGSPPGLSCGFALNFHEKRLESEFFPADAPTRWPERDAAGPRGAAILRPGAPNDRRRRFRLGLFTLAGAQERIERHVRRTEAEETGTEGVSPRSLRHTRYLGPTFPLRV